MSLHALALGEDNWKAEVEASPVPVLVDFWAAWCGPCRAIAPSVETLAERVKGRAKVGKVDVDVEPELAARFGVSSIPTLLVLRDGQVVAHHVGSLSLPDLERFLEQQLEPAAAR
jgi:thioredoxin 1